MKIQLPLAPEVAAPSVCRLLRSKTAFGVVAGESWKSGESTTAVYWCLNTMEAFGPDDRFAHPHHCAQGRACHQPDE